ncbi:sterol desaturase family protein [Burkholderia pseudomultivorans]|uniref:sterol desaturase family protein n=1 Tax=Burkholderia pseudomultivorans TaxID=1207504 RepID=UPI002876E4A6|nr:sterol desaturase family protein [Burkholderia pseudomultivorans]MDS0862312.1 sterol desaturase family protein [Burkholderia pseudomultivorans]
MQNLPNIMVAALPAFAVLIVVEIALATVLGRPLYRTRDTLANIALAAGAFVVSILTGGLVLTVLSWIYAHRIVTIPTNVWWAWVLCFFADDFSYYWFHRLSHEVRWFWASHSVHHSSEQYNFSVSLRQTWTGTITGSFLFWAWMPLVGFHPKMILFMQSVSLIYQFWIHTEAIDRMPRWFEAVLNTPSQHRVHHGSDFDYLDTNYAGTTMIWDRLFRSYAPERFTPHYGLTSSIGTDNPLRIAFYEWTHLARDVAKAGNLRTALNYLIQPPGWSPDGSSLTTRDARRAAQQAT